MDNFFKYLTAGDEDKNWGLYLHVAGKARISPNVLYPSIKHPTGYYFSWEKGRILQEYQLNYITEGFGILETNTGNYSIKPGTLMVTHPGIWHRYKPLKKSGWVENYIGFNGELAKQLLKKSFFQPEQSIIQCDIHEEFIDTYYKIFELVQKEKPGFQQIASGMIIKLLGYIIAFQKQRNFSGKEIEKVIRKVQVLMRENTEENIDLKNIASFHNIGYSHFRKMFKKYTGIAPHKYHLELKIMRAKELILTTDKAIKEISYMLGFQSIHYFSRLFKNKMGINPSDLRKVAKLNLTNS